MMNLNTVLQSTVYLVLVFTYSGSVPRWSWGSFAQIEQIGTDRCNSGYCVEKWKCPDDFVISIPSKPCKDQGTGPWVCCERETDVSRNSKNLMPFEILHPQLHMGESIVVESPFGSSPAGEFVLTTPETHEVRGEYSSNHQNQEPSNKSYATVMGKVSDEYQVEPKDLEYAFLSNERFSTNETGEKLLADNTYGYTHDSHTSRNKGNNWNHVSTRRNLNEHDINTSFQQPKEIHLSTSIRNSWPGNQVFETQKYSGNSFKDENKPGDKINEHLWNRPHSNSPWRKSTRAWNRSTIREHKKTTFSPKDIKYTSRDQNEDIPLWTQKTASNFRVKPTKTSMNSVYSAPSTIKTTSVWHVSKTNNFRKTTKSSWANHDSSKDAHNHWDNKHISNNQIRSTHFREQKTTNHRVNPTSYSTRSARKTSSHWDIDVENTSRKTTKSSWIDEDSSKYSHSHWDNKYTVNDQNGNTPFRERKTTPYPPLRPTKSTTSLTKSPSQIPNVWDIDIVDTHRKTTKPALDKGGYSKYTMHRTSTISKTTPFSLKPVTKISLIRDTENEYYKTNGQILKTTPKFIRKTSTPSWSDQYSSIASNKPTKVSLNRQSSTESRKKSTELLTSRSSLHLTDSTSRFNEFTSSRSKHTSTISFQNSRRSTFSTKKTTPRSSIVSSMHGISTSRQTTKTLGSNQRTSTIKLISTTPLPDISISTCGIRDRDAESDSSRLIQPKLEGTDLVSGVIYPESREKTSERQSFQRIVGGKEAKPFSWPWVAALYKVTSSGGNRFLCAGSLINEYFVLTAAHVFTPEDLRSSSFVVMLGTHTAKEALAEYVVIHVLQHPRYEQRYYYNDIALLRLERPVRFNDYVMPVCLPSPSIPLFRDEDLLGKKVTVMGWGDESFGGATSRVLKEATFPILSRQTCNASYFQVVSNRFPQGITHNMLCAGSPKGGKDACQGDSGGPLTLIEKGRYTQVGIVSFGYKCGDKDYPGVYTKVSPYLGWIAENARCESTIHYIDYYSDYH